MNVRDTSSNGDKLVCQIKYDMSMLQQQKLHVGHEDMSKPVNLT